MRARSRAAAATLFLLAAPAAAQFESASVANVQVNVVNPGGKSLAMGGAFVALADDATAAYANPAGLTQVSGVVAGVSGKNFRFEPPLRSLDFTQNGSALAATGTDLSASDNVSDLDFLSAVWGVSPGKVSLAIYRVVNLRYRFEIPAGSLPQYTVRYASGLSFSAAEEGGVDIRNESYGLSAAARFGPVSLGGGVTLSKLKYDLIGPRGGYVLSVREKRAPDLPASGYDQRVTTDVTTGSALGFVAGARVEIDERYRVSAGAVYRRGPRYDVSYSWQTLDGGFSATCGGTGRFDRAVCGGFKVPDDFSVGFAAAPVAGLLVAVEVQRVLYSQLNDRFVPLSTFTGVDSQGNDVFGVLKGVSDDATIPRVGLEWTFPAGAATLSLRAGYYHEPAHGSRVVMKQDANRDAIPDGGDVTIQDPPFSRALSGVFSGGEADDHVSAGLGATLSRSVSVDIAYDHGRRARYLSASVFVRF